MNLPPALAPAFVPPELPADAAALLAALPWGVLVLDAQGVLRYLNPQAAAWCGGRDAALLGQPLAAAPLPPALAAALRQLPPEATTPREVWLPGTRQWLRVRAAPAPAGQRWVFLENATASHEAEAARQRSTQLLLDMEEVAHTGSYEADLASGSFYFSDGMYRLFGEAPQAFEVTLEAIDARSHPADAATVRQVLDEAVRTRQPYAYRRRVRRADGTWRTLEAHGEVRCDATGQPVQLRGLVQDISERVQAEQARRAGHELLQRTIDSSLDLVQVFEAVRDEHGAVVDFIWVLNNAAAEQVYGDVIGQRLCEHNPGVVAEGIFDMFKKVLETGVPDHREHHYRHEQFDGWFYQSTVQLGDGVTTTTHDISARKRLEQELRASQTLLQDIIDAPHIGLAVYRAVRDEAGEVVDFVHEYINRASREMLGEDFTGRLFSDHGENGRHQLAQLGEVLATGQRNSYLRETDFRGRPVWFAITNTPLDGDRLVHTWEDVTARQQAQHELLRLKEELAQHVTDKYRTLFTSIGEGFCLLARVGSSPVDFVYVEANEAFTRQLGTDGVVGRTIRDVFPGAPEGGYDLYEQVWQTGEPVHTELPVPSIGRTIDVHAFRVGPPEAPQVAVLFSDITARKRREADAALLVAITEDLNRLAGEDELLAAVGAQLTQHLGLDCWHCVDVDEARAEMTVRHFWHAQAVPTILGTYPLAGFLSPAAVARLRAGTPAVVADVQATTPSDSEANLRLKVSAAAQHIAAYIAVPYSVGGQWRAYFALASSRPRPWTDAETALVQEVAARVFPRVARARAEAALRDSEERFRTVANLVPDLLWRSTLDSDTDWYNEQWYDYTGQTPETAAGYGWTDVIHPDDRAESARRYHAALTSGQFLRQEHRIRSAQGEYRWFQVQARALRNEHGEITACYGAATDIHARKLAELRLHESELKYRTLFDSIDEGFNVLELLVDAQGKPADFRILQTNRVWQQQTGLADAVGHTLREVTPAFEPALFDAYAEVALSGQAVRLEYYTAAVGRWYTAFATRIGGAESRQLAVVFDDITERKRRERQQQFLLQLSDVLRPLADPLAIQQAALRFVAEQLGLDRLLYDEINPDVTTYTVRAIYVREGFSAYGGVQPMGPFTESVRALQQGITKVVYDVDTDESFSPEEKAICAGIQVRAFVVVPLLKNGQWVLNLVAHSSQPRPWPPHELYLLQETAERTWTAVERARAEEALAASEQRQRALIANLPGAAAFVVGPDLRYQLAGGEALDAAGLAPADLLGCTVAEAMPPALVPQYEAHYRQALAGQGFSLEHAAHGRTFVSRGVPLLGAAGQPEAVLVVSYDISARKRAEEALRASQAQLAELNTQLEQRVARRTQQLQTSRDLLQSVLDTSLIAMSVMYAVRDEAGQVQDFRLALVNKKLEQETGRTDLVGKLYAQEYPGVRQEGLFDLMLRALATNEPQTLEYFYDHEGFNRWYTCQFVKMGDGVVATNLDITERKTAEQERLKNLRLLEQAEAVAGLGSWDYELATGYMRWSSGMYHLVGLPLGQPVSPEVYLQFVVDDDRPRAEQLVRRLTAGQNAEQTLRLRVGEQLKTVRLKAIVLRDAAGQPARVLGVELDISELQRLEADNLRLRLGQQQALFEAAQAAQEEERRRMSESLHNGIGQLLYATKLQLDHLPADADFSPRHRAAELLGEAIRQTRALSHELTPATLEEFGLEATLRSMCTTLSTPALRWRCQLVLDEGPALPPPLQLAVYRLAQELAQNVLKHAHATAATLEVEVLPGWVVLRVEDNGQGFDPAHTSDGLGLRTLRSRAALLGGNVHVATTPGQGTQCQVRLPLATGFL